MQVANTLIVPKKSIILPNDVSGPESQEVEHEACKTVLALARGGH
jgi:hypothetical protein